MASRKELTSTHTLIVIDSDLATDLLSTLNAVKVELAKSVERERQAKLVADDNRLLNEPEACEYLRRDADTLAYYRNHGLESYKRGRDRWYRKGDIDRCLAEGKVNRRLNL